MLRERKRGRATDKRQGHCVCDCCWLIDLQLPIDPWSHIEGRLYWTVRSMYV